MSSKGNSWGRWPAGHKHIPIDSSMYLEETTIKAIMELKFNPAKGVAHLSLADKGLPIMACRGCTSSKMEQIREHEKALLATENTRQLDKLLRLSKGVTGAPAENFWELKINIAMFMSLIRVLFGSECDYYKGLQNVCATLELKEVMAQKSSFMVEHCCRITWAILDDRFVHVDDVKMTLDFRGPDKPVFPQSFLTNILRNVCYAIPVERATFPDEWKQKVKTTTYNQGGRNAGGGSGQQRGRDRHS
jgi:hypothetical protein